MKALLFSLTLLLPGGDRDRGLQLYQAGQFPEAAEAFLQAIATEGDTDIAEYCDDVLYVPECFEPFSPIIVAIPVQLFAYYIAVNRGCDVDQPRNLAKSVTVE